METKYFKLILEDKYKKLANLQCDLAVFESLPEEQELGDKVQDKTTGEMIPFDVKYAKGHISRQIEEVKKTIEVNIKLIKDAKKK